MIQFQKLKKKQIKEYIIKGGMMMFNFFGKQITINNKKWKQDLLAWSLLYRTEIVIAIASFILGAIIF